MHTNACYVLISAALLLMLAVMTGAFGAHALKQSMSTELLAVYKIAVEYQFIHALGLLAIGLLIQQFPRSRLLFYAALGLIGSRSGVKSCII